MLFNEVMMKVEISKLVGGGLLVAGAAFVWLGAGSLSPQVKSQPYRAFALPGSPYGEVIGLALQDPVHLLWHGGAGHEHVGRKGEKCEVCGVDHSQEEGKAGGRHAELENNPIVRWKLSLLDLAAAVRQKNNPRAHAGAVVDYEQERVRSLVKLAYEMDPTNYGNYNMYVHFMLTHGISSGEYTMDDFYRVSEATIAMCTGRDEDPEDALTAASAAENMLIYKLRGVDKADYWKFEEDYNRFVAEVRRFERNQARAEREGRLKSYQPEKVKEIGDRFQGFHYIRNSYGKLIAESKLKRQQEGK